MEFLFWMALLVVGVITIQLETNRYVFGFSLTQKQRQKHQHYLNNNIYQYNSRYQFHRDCIVSCSATKDGSSPDTDTNYDDPFMASLKLRVEQVTDRATKLPIIILDSILPRQILNITVPSDALLLQLIKTQITNETPYFGMLGLIRNRNRKSIGEQELQKQQLLLPLSTGVQVDIVGKPKMIFENDGTTSIQILLRGTMKRFKINKEVITTKDGWMEARVTYMNCIDDETECIISTTKDQYQLARAMSKARILPNLINEWIVLARHHERHPYQIDTILNDIGTIPTCEEPTNLSFWIGALINPLPALGVAYEIRPSLLLAETAEERVDIVIEGIQKSIRHMQGEPLL
jgi:ATP-dependent protease La (LON) substrate-binding domain